MKKKTSGPQKDSKWVGQTLSQTADDCQEITHEAICIGEGFIKSCDFRGLYCEYCTPGHQQRVDRKSCDELVELAGRNANHVRGLMEIIDELNDLAGSSKLGKLAKDRLGTLCIRTAQLTSEIHWSGHTLFYNLLLDNSGNDSK